MNWCENPTVAILSGNLGNRLYQYFAAKTLIDRVGAGTVSNAHFPEWNLILPTQDPENFRRVLLIEEIEDFNIEHLAAQINQDRSVYIMNRSHLQSQKLYSEPSVYNAIFPIVAPNIERYDSTYLLINIRTGDILGGHPPHYPLTPIAFYSDIVHSTGLKPVFLGQLGPCRYVDALKSSFPKATFIESRGAISDFDTIRSAANIIPAVSTFSLAAAWLSSARRIFLPLNGFLNPSHMRDIDLVPVGDPRYRFFLFPMNFALPEEEALQHHARMVGKWSEISSDRVAFLQKSSPLLGKATARSLSLAPSGYNERFYVHQHMDVAIDISNGWYESGLHHYMDIGRSIGYSAGPMAAYETPLPNLALNRPAWQSSTSNWSRGCGIQQDAMRAVNGDREKEIGFHTDLDDSPWWLVDCSCAFILREVHIYNRKGPLQLQERATPLRVEVSRDLKRWSLVYETAQGTLFGVGLNRYTPLVCYPVGKTVTRYVRISVPGRKTYLHLAEVEVYGIPV
jgi:hypothetical protein